MEKYQLRKVLAKSFPKLSSSSLNQLLEHIAPVRYSKGTKLFIEGERHPYFYKMLKGGVKSYYKKDAKEVCLWFAFEDETIGSIQAFKGNTSLESIELLEDSELVQFDQVPIKKLAQSNVEISNFMIDHATEHAIFLEERIYRLQFKSSQERYWAMLQKEPEILKRVSLTDIASYLGISRETLSRIRGKK